jgi:DNA mismatch repair protein MutL
MAIQVLPPEVVDQISAGEVVERPAHMVKELVENSIDAGATEVDIDFAQGGRWVKIKDNGSGMSKEDLQLCLSRHATSKIRKAIDIWNLNSFGFRGEALASISSICRLKITTRTHQSDSALALNCEFGQQQPIDEVGGEVGTTIQIEELFENMPVRLKFLKSEGAESTAIKNSLKALAMAHPKVNFRVRQKGKLLYYWTAEEDLCRRVEQVLERDALFFAKGECEGIQVQAVLSSPNDTVRNSRQIWLFVQNRSVQDRSLQTAVMEGYRGLLMHGEYPVAAIWVRSAPDEIDVNIHPTKSQVKFRDPSSAFRAVNRAVRGLLEQAPWLEGLLPSKAKTQNGRSEPLGQYDLSAQSYQEKKPPSEDFVIRRTPNPQSVTPSEQTEAFVSEAFQRIQYADRTFPENSDRVESSLLKYSENQLHKDSAVEKRPSYWKKKGEHSVGLEPSFHRDPVKSSSHAPQGVQQAAGREEASGVSWSNLQVIGQAHLTYIVAQSDESMVFVDQHAAHERVAYERLMDAWETGKIEVQNFLLPVEVELDEEEQESLLQQRESFLKFGLQIEKSQKNSVEVYSAPAMIKDSAIARTVEKLAQETFERGDSFALDKCVREIFATMACHSVVRAGQPLSIAQMQELLKEMDRLKLSSFCPHGRPVFVEYPFNKLERDFGRIV